MSNTPFCDNCIHGQIDYNTYDIRCAKTHPVRFQLPKVQLHRQDYTQPWGFVPVHGSCSDYRTIIPTADKPKYSRNRALERVHRKAHIRVVLPVPQEPVPSTIRLPVQDLPGLEALEQKYAAAIANGRAVSDQLE